MPIDPLVKILDRPLSEYDSVTRDCIREAQRRWSENFVTNLDGTAEHKDFVRRTTRDLLQDKVDRGVRTNEWTDPGYFKPDPFVGEISGPSVVDLDAADRIDERAKRSAYGPVARPPAPSQDHLGRTQSESNRTRPGDNVRREEIERGRQRDDFGYIAGAQNDGAHDYIKDDDYDPSGKTYGRVSTRPSSRHPWQNKTTIRR